MHREGLKGIKINFFFNYVFRSYIAHPASSWIDDYFDWLLSVGRPSCCRQYKDNLDEFCPSSMSFVLEPFQPTQELCPVFI